MKYSFQLSVLCRLFCVAWVATLTACHCPGGSKTIQESDYSRPIRVACIGDSITYGFGFMDRDRDSYPAHLGRLLGTNWIVKNFGVNGATALREGSRPYHQQQAYRDALAFEPDVIILKLGTNDTAERNWGPHREKFPSDYLHLVRTLQAMESEPRIYLCRPVPLFRDRRKSYDTDKILTESVIPQIEKVAKKHRLPVIDLYTPFDGKEAMFPDGVHPDSSGTRLMAETVYARLTGKLSTEQAHSK